MAKMAKNLNDVLPPELQEGKSEKLSKFMDKALIIHTCRDVVGQHGPYVRLVVSETEGGDQFYLSTGASQAMEILHWLKDNNAFPVKGKFVQAGDAILLQGVD